MDEKRKLSLSEVNSLLHKSEHTRIAPLTQSDEAYRRSAVDLLNLLDKKVKSVFVGGIEVVATKRPDSDTMYIRPKEGFVPCGWIDRSWLDENIVRKTKRG